jgi:surface polysaccharide O-acyltransferase-like enzyme
MKKEKIVYIDNLRVLLMILVILHHSFITYGAPGGWYYIEASKKLGALIPMTLFVATNQSFFMGFFFFLSALFIDSSLKKKGRLHFTVDRLKRLGIPLVFYVFVLSPILVWLVVRFGDKKLISFPDFEQHYRQWIGVGVLWFVAALLLFTLIYVFIRPLIQSEQDKIRPVPNNSRILVFALSLGILSYLVRIFFPVGWSLQPFGFQLAYFSQYVAMFILGIVASRNHWLEQFDVKKARPFLRLALIMMFLIFPLMYVIKIVTGCTIESFSGKGTYQSLLSASWEQITGISIMVVLLGYGREKWNRQSALLKNMSRSAYAVYIFHPLVIISLSLLCIPLRIDPALKLLIVAPLAVIFSFTLGSLLVKIPGVDKII